jgi:hypothetical protein
VYYVLLWHSVVALHCRSWHSYCADRRRSRALARPRSRCNLAACSKQDHLTLAHKYLANTQMYQALTYTLCARSLPRSKMLTIAIHTQAVASSLKHQAAPCRHSKRYITLESDRVSNHHLSSLESPSEHDLLFPERVEHKQSI